MDIALIIFYLAFIGQRWSTKSRSCRWNDSWSCREVPISVASKVIKWIIHYDDRKKLNEGARRGNFWILSIKKLANAQHSRGEVRHLLDLLPVW